MKNVLEKKLIFFLRMKFVFASSVFACLLIYGCGSTNIPSTIAPETGGTANTGALYSPKANRLQIGVTPYQYTGQQSGVAVYAFNSGGSLDSSTQFTWTLTSNDPNFQYTSITRSSPTAVNCIFNSIVHHSPTVTVTATGTSGNLTIGPVSVSPYMWVYSVGAGDITYESQIPHTLVNDLNNLPTPVSPNSSYCTLPTEIIDTTQLPNIVPLNNLQIMVFAGSTVSGTTLGPSSGLTVVGVGPWYGGPDTKLPLYNNVGVGNGGTCDNYWNWPYASSNWGLVPDNSSIVSSESLFYESEPYFFGPPQQKINTFYLPKIGISDAVWIYQKINNNILNQPWANKVDWRFQ